MEVAGCLLAVVLRHGHLAQCYGWLGRDRGKFAGIRQVLQLARGSSRVSAVFAAQLGLHQNHEQVPSSATDHR
ncbi:MAG: hypothetical protein JOZ81_18410 [Chloroflexi bacterium]|nr:hypothetical protein [Chloroflexota bacterium]